MFVLSDIDGKEVDARELVGAGPLVVVFLRGVWCRYSNCSAKAIEDLRGGDRESLRGSGRRLAADCPARP